MQVKDDPRVSVVIACRNAADTIGLQLQALVDQLGVEPFEVVVADNGSTDDLHGVVGAFSETLDIRLVSAAERAGAAYARNVGVREARGDFILFCDADDVVGPRWVQAMADALRAEDVVVTGPIQSWDGVTVPRATSGLPTTGPLTKGGYLPTAGGCNAGYRRSTIVELGGMDMSFRGGSEDVDLSWRAQEAGRPLRFVEGAFIFYRVRESRHGGYRQHYRWNREDVRLWALGVRRGHDSRMVSLKGSVMRLRQVPSLIRGMWSNPVEASTLGCVMGSLAGHARYRLPGRAPGPDLMPPAWFARTDKRRGDLHHVTFLTNSMSAPNGVVSAVDALAGAFEQAGIGVKILTWGDADDEFATRHDLVRLRTWHRYTVHMRGYESSNPALKPVRRALTPFVLVLERMRARRILAQIPDGGLVIASGMECLEYAASLGCVRSPIAVQVHSGVETLSSEQLERLHRCAELVDAVTVFTFQDLDALGQLGIGHGVVIPNAVPPRVGTEPRERRRRVVFAGRLEPLKQVDHIVRAFAAVAPQDWTLNIYGIGPSESELRGLAEQLSPRITFHGHVRDMGAIFADASIHVMASQYEGLPMTIVEAASYGVPTVTYASSPGTVLAVGDHGIHVPLGDQEALAHALQRLMVDDEELLERSGRAASDTRFNGDNVVGLWQRLWREMSGGCAHGDQPRVSEG